LLRIIENLIEGTVIAPFDMAVLNDMDPLSPGHGYRRSPAEDRRRGIYLKQQLEDKLIEHGL
jgi:xylulose-5-phosphate/fructose-6-phosphate phosphoketolase